MPFLVILRYIGYLVLAIILGIGIGSTLIFFYKLIKKFINRKRENKSELPLYKKEVLDISDSYIIKQNSQSIDFMSPTQSDSQVNLYPNQKILQSTEEEQNINTLNTINRLIDRDKAKQKANIDSILI
ncbi:hypothetical protein H8356DRAFT_1309406 [Neocallimastix lanati (nom. inval.)]|jgi:hypothetical protein|uniref:Transmembrane protein n=1 Tax=Neocallimastix californiae TaxID=1754190 RepID=A0A1Y2D598_9FUNG|nr:hypothetical protein H8356DRAFT_1309406 [Neocallimastix sp. JGI-2020a]ORY54489.1 hypothetical protein LY90DRAFT_669949 [Neocallimastix californiae]|eukprot:ORY54489.1 hypothetical protein LY90DRAFT_669949 [Neocallimastix californiae]